MKPNVEKIVAVLEGEVRGLCEAILCEYDGSRRRQIGCFAGSLLFRAGMPSRDIEKCQGGLQPMRAKTATEREMTRKAVALLATTYDLDARHLRTGIAWNDDGSLSETPLERRDRMVRLVRRHWSQRAATPPEMRQ
jgi:hypothetical protein